MMQPGESSSQSNTNRKSGDQPPPLTINLQKVNSNQTAITTIDPIAQLFNDDRSEKKEF